MAFPSIDGYRISRRIGTGRTADVYLARDERRRGNVALKVLRQANASDRSLSEWFSMEWALLASITHDHVVKVFDYGASGEHAFLVMEHVGGGSVRELIAGGIPPARALSLLRQAACAAAAAHRQDIVHRDLKPDNLLLRPDKALLLADFGAALRLTHQATGIGAGTMVGSPAYAAPEQTQGDVPTPAADVYSLGIVLFEMLCGRRPFAGETVMEVLAQHLKARVPRLPDELAQFQPIIDAMLEKNTKRRLPDGDAVLDEIEHIDIDFASSTWDAGKASGPSSSFGVLL